MSRPASRRWGVRSALAIVLVGSWWLGPAVTATAQSAPPPPTDTPNGNQPQVSVPDIIPEPNSGVAPETATDRGGWAQYAVLGGIVGGIALIGALVVRDSRRARRQGRRSSTRSEPVAERTANRPDSSARQ